MGNKRDALEDYAAFEEITTKGGLPLKIGMVCDGTSMGLGSYYGSRAAHMTAEIILNTLYASTQFHILSAIKEAVQAANTYIYQNEKGKSTLAMFVIHSASARLYIASVGNSVIGLVRNSQFIRLNVDHTVASEQILTGQADKIAAYQHPKAHYLTRIIGMNELKVDTGLYHEQPDAADEEGEKGLTLQNRDVILAFSDGLVDFDGTGVPCVHEADFITMAQKMNLDQAAHEVLKKALARGAEDNLALVSARYEHLLRPFETRILDDSVIELAYNSRPADQTLIEHPAVEVEPSAEYVLGIKPIFGDPNRSQEYQRDILVIMPPEKASIYEEHVQSIAQRLGFSIHRSDDLFTENAIIKDIWSSIYSTRLIIADCTGRNPNVFYELGIAHTLGRPAVMVTQQTQDIPFDVRDRRFLQYDGDLSYASMVKFQKKLESVLAGFINSKMMPPPPSNHSEARPIFGRPSVNPQHKASIFMMMPFTDEMRDIYNDHVVYVAKNLNLTIAAGDDFFTQHAIMQDIWSAIYHADLIIADCTGRNPNVFYELGIAHTLGKPVVLMTSDPNDVPTDLRHLRYLHYSYTPRGMKQFEEKLREAVQKIREF